MQNNNSKLNTILLIILIILAAFCLWKISDDNREEENDSNEIKTEQTENNNDEKEEVSDQETTTYQYPSSGPAFFTMEAKGNPTVTTSSGKMVFSGSSGTDTVWYSTGFTGGTGYPCFDDLNSIPYPGTKEIKIGTDEFTVCSYKGTTTFIEEGFEGSAVVITSSGSNQTSPHYIDLETIKFVMEVEN